MEICWELVGLNINFTAARERHLHRVLVLVLARPGRGSVHLCLRSLFSEYASYIEDMLPSDEYPPSDRAPPSSQGESGLECGDEVIVLGILGVVVLVERGRYDY